MMDRRALYLSRLPHLQGYESQKTYQFELVGEPGKMKAHVKRDDGTVDIFTLLAFDTNFLPTLAPGEEWPSDRPWERSERQHIVHGLTENMGLKLASLIEHKGWHHGCGWVWSDNHETASAMKSLVKRGMAKVCPHPHGRQSPYYEATDFGRSVAAEHLAERRRLRKMEKDDEDRRRGITPDYLKQAANERYIHSLKRQWSNERYGWESETVLDALRQIADGHNNPRSLAEDVLWHIGDRQKPERS